MGSAGVGLILKGIFVPHAAQASTVGEDETSKSSRTSSHARPKKIHFNERIDLVNSLNQQGTQLNAQKKHLSQIEARLAAQKQELEKSASLAGFSGDSSQILRDQNCFMNRVTVEDAAQYGTFSSLVYSIEKNKDLVKASTKTTQRDREISVKQQEIDMLAKEILHIPSDHKGLKNFVKNINRTIGSKLDVEDSTYAQIQETINGRLDALHKEVDALQQAKTLADSVYIEAARQRFALNLQGMNYEIKGVFHRNDGQFSGVGAYDKDKKKLVLSFAGSKSLSDWAKNLFGWNQKLSSRHGLLSNISFHSGFGSHLDDNADSFFSFMRGFLEDFKKDNPNGTLNLIGTGHSLGGALGEIFGAAAKELAASMGVKVDLGIMTFGAPNTVNQNTLGAYTKLIGGAGNVIRIAHSYDPVPKLVFWKSAPGALSIEEDNSLFKDVNGTMMLPVNTNPHNSDEYYHSAGLVFSKWQEKLSPVKAYLGAVQNLEAQKEEAEKSIGQIASQAHQLLMDLANQDKNSADIFEDEYEHYVSQQQEELKPLQGSLRALSRDLASRKEKGDVFTFQEQEDFMNQIRALQKKVADKQDFIKNLQKDTAWRGYANQISDEFDRLMSEISSDSLLLSIRAESR
jgi:hypothetical protein